MLDSKGIKQYSLTPGETIALALFDRVHTRYPEKIRNVIEMHDNKFTGDPNADLVQVVSLAKTRGRYFTEDMEGALKDLHFNNFGDLWDKLKSGTGKILTNDLVQTGAGVAANIFAPGTGTMASGALETIGQAISDKPPVNAPSTFSWPPEAEFPRQAWANLVADPKASKSDLAAALKKAKDLVTEYQRQTDEHTAKGHLDNAKGTAIWRDAAAAFVTAFQSKIDNSDTKTEDLLKDIFSKDQKSPNLDERDGADKFKEKMDKDQKDKEEKDAEIVFLGMTRKQVRTGGLVLLIILILSISIWLYMRHKKKLAEKKAA